MKVITQDWVGLGEDQAVHGHTMQRPFAGMFR